MAAAQPSAPVARIIAAHHPELGAMFAAVDPSARFTTPGLRPSRFAAQLAPFRDERDAIAALNSAGATIEERQ